MSLTLRSLSSRIPSTTRRLRVRENIRYLRKETGFRRSIQALATGQTGQTRAGQTGTGQTGAGQTGAGGDWRSFGIRLLGRAIGALTPRREMKPLYIESERWWDHDTVAVVTGANKGIGYCIAKGLANEGMLTILTSRDPALGEKATEQLCAEGKGNVVYHQLDITDRESIDKFAKWIGSKYKGVNILVNNAGMAYKGNTFGAREAETTIATNYKGTRAVTEALLPLMRPSPAGARIINVCSQAGLLKILGPGLQKRLLDPSLTAGQLDELAAEFVTGIEKGDYSSKGWPASMYGVSKVLESAYTRVLAKELSSRPDGQKIFVNACCPGWCATDMSSHMGPKSAEEGADTALFLALQPSSNAKTGSFFYERAKRSF